MAHNLWIYIFLMVGGLLAAFRIWQNLQKLRQRKNDTWDERLIDQLRKRGSDPFKPHDVDFFLAFKTQEVADQLATELRAEGFDVDVLDTPENGELRYSLHAHKSMKLTVPDMKELSRRLSETANARGGRYDGWSAKEVPRTSLTPE